MEGLILGLIQGVTEWLPVSSKTQVMFMSMALGLEASKAYLVGLALEGGSVVAAAVYLRREVLSILSTLLRGRVEPTARALIIMTISTAPTAIPLYLATIPLAEALGPSIMILAGAALMVYGAASAFLRIGDGGLTVDNVPQWKFVIAGLAQGLSAMPGVSRSGITIAVLMLLGLNPRDAVKISYLAFIPVGLGATVLAMPEAISVGLPLHAAIAVSAAAGYVTIGAVMRLASKGPILAIVLGLIASSWGLYETLSPP